MLTVIQDLRKHDKKTYRLFLFGMAILGILLAVFILLLIRNAMIHRELNFEMQAMKNYENKDLKTNVPTEERLRFLTEQLNQLKEVDENLPVDLLLQQHDQNEMKETKDPLAFKEKLFEVKQTLRQKALSQGIAFPEQYGLEEYETQLPEEKDLPQLSFLLEVVQALLGELIEAKVNLIEKMVLGEIVETEFPGSDAGAYEEFYLALRFQATESAASAFWDALLEIKRMVQVINLDMVPLESDELNQELFDVTIEVSVFSLKEQVR